MFVFGALLLAFALMQVDLTAVLLLVGAYLLVQGYAVYCRIRLEKEMRHKKAPGALRRPGRLCFYCSWISSLLGCSGRTISRTAAAMASADRP